MEPASPAKRRAAPPLDSASLDRLALRYVERFATTRRRLTDYLNRKIRSRGWAGPPVDPATIAERFAALGYIDDRSYGAARAGAMARRGLGARRVAGALRAAGVAGEDAEALAPDIADSAVPAAIAFARRKRLGPFASTAPDRPLRDKQLAAMVRAGHGFDLARQILAMAPGDEAALVQLRSETDGSGAADFS
jgi:regulatory protein